MKNWKKLLTLVLAMVLCLSISACGGDSGDGGETADAPAVLEDYAYDSAADASGYDAYIGNWVGTGDAENDTLEVTTTDGGMYFTIYYINDIKASGAAQNVPEYDDSDVSMLGMWYQDGDENAESRIEFDDSGNWSLYEVQDGEYAEVDYGTLSSTAEEGMYNAVSDAYEDVSYDLYLADTNTFYWGGENDCYQRV